MRQIRKNVFETNSSSTHCIAICTEDDYEKWKNGELFYNILTESFVKNDIVITQNDRQAAKEQYDRIGNKYYKDFNDLSEEIREEYILNYVKTKKMQEHRNPFENENYNLMTYNEYRDHYSNLEFDTTYYTSPSGDKLVIACAYGYD